MVTGKLFKQLFTSVFDASGHEQKFYVCIDALDECEGALSEHVAFLPKMAAEHQSTLWMCISSRPLPALVAQLGSHPNLVLQDKSLTDISHFVEDKLRSAHVNMDTDVIWLRDEIIEKANGVFLWVHLVVEEIFEGYEEGDTVSELRDRLSAIPSGLDQLFMRIWRMIDERHTQEAIAMLNAHVCAIRPLSLSEFRYALALSSKASFPSLRQLTLSEDLVRNDIEMTKRIRSRCGGLVEVSNNIVQFIHQSVKDWMQIMDVANASEPDRKVDQIRNHQPLLQACLRYLVDCVAANCPFRLDTTRSGNARPRGPSPLSSRHINITLPVALPVAPSPSFFHVPPSARRGMRSCRLPLLCCKDSLEPQFTLTAQATGTGKL
ncbi:MAG: hypothetical protein LQ347_003886 [Umbilicaria vellea]|nr:MAG: hypothetical protein LQ347_003886 [Umbilicaria vellea]